MKSNNVYLKEIANNTGSDITKRHSDNYYLHRIADNTANGGGGSGNGNTETMKNVAKAEILNMANAYAEAINKENNKEE